MREGLENDPRRELEKSQLARIGNAYGVGPLRMLDVVATGLLNRNFHVQAESGDEYFLREHRDIPVTVAEKHHAAERFLSRPDIPIVVGTSLHGKNEQSVFVDGEKLFSLYPWVTGRRLRSMELSDTAIRSLADVEARMHLLSKGGDAGRIVRTTRHGME